MLDECCRCLSVSKGGDGSKPEMPDKRARQAMRRVAREPARPRCEGARRPRCDAHRSGPPRQGAQGRKSVLYPPRTALGD